MNRWFSTSYRHPLRRFLQQALSVASTVFLAGLPMAMSPHALAQTTLRHFPDAALRGQLEVTAPPVVTINGEPTRLTPGSRIYGPQNQMVMSGQLVGQPVVVNYLRNPQGQVHEIWILNAAELKADRKDRPGSEPKTNFRFGSDANPSAAVDLPFNQLPKYKN